VIGDFTTSSNLLRKLKKQTSTVVSSETSTKVIPPLHFFRFFQRSISKIYLRTFMMPNSVRLMPWSFFR